ncbi:MAG: S8 family peptidase [Mycobacterium sp.]
MTDVPPPPGPRRTSVVSPLVMGDTQTAPPGAERMMLVDAQDRRVVLIELRLDRGASPDAVRRRFRRLFRDVFGTSGPPQPVPIARHYMRCVLAPDEITRLVRGGDAGGDRGLGLIYRVWPDLVLRAHLDRSVSTIKADAAIRTFGSAGTGIVWAVLDSGIDATHPHFATHDTLTASAVAKLHRDFTIPSSPDAKPSPLADAYGHGTHVAGIIAGQAPKDPALLRIAYDEPTAQDLPQWALRTLPAGTTLSGVAPKANLVSIKVLDDNGNTLSSAVIQAIDYIRTVNSGGRDLQIHGVNMSFGCPWPPTEYAAGQSPLCRELDLLVGTGVLAVVSAGNAGAGGTIEGPSGDVYGQLSTISDPGNAACAVTVGSVHRYRPHTYGVTFNSSKGPTLDGRPKPDVVAPGERITSAATGDLVAGVPPLAPAAGDPKNLARYREDSGTSMSAAHVSGAMAAFMSARNEYVGQPFQLKKLFCDTATDLGRHEFYQGTGLIDLMRALSSS